MDNIIQIYAGCSLVFLLVMIIHISRTLNIFDKKNHEFSFSTCLIFLAAMFVSIFWPVILLGWVYAMISSISIDELFK